MNLFRSTVVTVIVILSTIFTRQQLDASSVSDPDNDPLRMSWAKPAITWTQWLFGWVINSIFPNLSGTSVSFTAPSLARTATVPYDASVADGRGGSAQGRTYVPVSPASPGLPPSGTLTVSPTDAPAGSSVCCFTASSTTVSDNRNPYGFLELRRKNES